MKTQVLNIVITLNREALGTLPANHELHAEYIAAKAPTTAKAAEEEEAVPAGDQFEKAMTVFARDSQGCAASWDYQFKGMIKGALGALIELGQVTGISKWAHKGVVDRCLFVTPRLIRWTLGGQPLQKLELLQRPLRAETMQGARVCLATSEVIPVGAEARFTVTLLESSNSKSAFAKFDVDTLRACLDYGKFYGFSQWRNAGYGTYDWSDGTPAANHKAA